MKSEQGLTKSAGRLRLAFHSGAGANTHVVTLSSLHGKSSADT